jgi:hypothetical protein
MPVIISKQNMRMRGIKTHTRTYAPLHSQELDIGLRYYGITIKFSSLPFTVGNFPRRTSVHDMHVAFQIPYVYDYITKSCRQQAEVILNHEN